MMKHYLYQKSAATILKNNSQVKPNNPHQMLQYLMLSLMTWLHWLTSLSVGYSVYRSDLNQPDSSEQHIVTSLFDGAESFLYIWTF